MLIKFKLSSLAKTTFREYSTRFVLGGMVCVLTGLIAEHFGPVVGGLFLAFPAIFPASATLLEHHERDRKARAGIAFTIRGRLAAALDARGACMGALALVPFALIIWRLVPSHSPAAVITAALAAWIAVATITWRLRRLHTRFWIRRHVHERA